LFHITISYSQKIACQDRSQQTSVYGWELARRLPENRKPTAEKPFQPFFTLIFVKDNPYSPLICEKNDSKWLSLATASIHGQPPRRLSVNQ